MDESSVSRSGAASCRGPASTSGDWWPGRRVIRVRRSRNLAQVLLALVIACRGGSDGAGDQRLGYPRWPRRVRNEPAGHRLSRSRRGPAALSAAIVTESSGARSAWPRRRSRGWCRLGCYSLAKAKARWQPVMQLGAAAGRRVEARTTGRPLRRGLAAGQRPVRPHVMARVAVRILLQVVLVLGLGLPERPRRLHLGDDLGRPQA